jgi:hypothetical protein
MNIFPLSSGERVRVRGFQVSERRLRTTLTLALSLEGRGKKA